MTESSLPEQSNGTSISPKPISDPTGITLLHALSGHTYSISWAGWSPDGKLLASTSGNYTVRIWDSTSGALLHILSGHTGMVRKGAWSPDGKLLASVAWDLTARIWDPISGKLLHTLSSSSLRGMLQTARAMISFFRHEPGNDPNEHSVAWSPDGQSLFVGFVDHTVRVWNAILLDKTEVILSRAQRAHARLSQAGSGSLAILAFQQQGK